MSTEGGEGHKPRPWAETKVKKDKDFKDTTSTSVVAENLDDIKPKASAFGARPHSQSATIVQPEATDLERKIGSKVSDRNKDSSKKEFDTEQTQSELPPRQVIAVSASKGPAAFFNLARKFLVTDETCDLSALEGAIVSAVDAAHLLERSKLATIIRIQTSYVAVGPKRKKATTNEFPTGKIEEIGRNESISYSQSIPMETGARSSDRITRPQAAASVARTTPSHLISTPMATELGVPRGQGLPISGKPKESSPGVKEPRRARMIITVKRTEEYKKWLEQNPL